MLWFGSNWWLFYLPFCFSTDDCQAEWTDVTWTWTICKHCVLLILPHQINKKGYTDISCLMPNKSLQSCQTLGYCLYFGPPGTSVHGILQARILEWVAISFSKRSSRPRNQTNISYISCMDRLVLYHYCLFHTRQILQAVFWPNNLSFCH